MIKKASKSDILELYTLENDVFSKENFPIGKSSFYYHVKNNHLYVFKKNGLIAGYILWLSRKYNYRLYSLAVKKEFRGQDIANELLEYSLKKLKKKSYILEVKVDNIGAIKLYEKYDFRIAKTLKDYYPDLKDGYLMKKTIT